MDTIVESSFARFPECRFREPFSLTLREGENWVAVGPNGAGKTLFSNLLRGGGIRTLAFRDIYSVTGVESLYSQQRWNSSDSWNSPEVSSLFRGFDSRTVDRYMSLFGIGHLLDRRVVALSGGELRKLLITRALMYGPSLLVLDNPFIGLDEGSRKTLCSMLRTLSRETGLGTLLLLSQVKDIPSWADKVLPISDMRVMAPVPGDVFLSDPHQAGMLFPEASCNIPVLPAPEAAGVDYENALEMRNVRVRYSGHDILRDENWTVRRGEHWALLGENGSGKSTLLSLVCGDNPQAYANDISVFGRRRGSGDSIWEIKRRIGYLSPDVHSCYLEDIPCIKVVASGFSDSVGLSGECSGSEYAAAARWMEIFGASHLAGRSFVRISYGEQRLVLLARAFVKSPELLVLDEPLHGLDTGRKNLALGIIGKYCSDPAVTLIYVTHYMDEIPQCVTKFKTMHRLHGRI